MRPFFLIIRSKLHPFLSRKNNYSYTSVTFWEITNCFTYFNYFCRLILIFYSSKESENSLITMRSHLNPSLWWMIVNRSNSFIPSYSLNSPHMFGNLSFCSSTSDVCFLSVSLRGQRQELIRMWTRTLILWPRSLLFLIIFADFGLVPGAERPEAWC